MSLYVGTTSGLYELNSQIELVVGGTRVNHLARGDRGLWMADGKGRIHHGNDIVATMPAGSTPLCLQPTPSAVFIGSTEARLFALEDGGVVEDEFFADAPGRETWYTPWGGPADVRSMALDNDSTLYINVHVGGILRYDNTGITATIDLGADVHQVATHPTRQGAVFAACAYGLAASNNGHDFEIRSDGLHASYCRAVAVLDEAVVVSASTGPSTSRGRLYRSQLWEGSFEPLSNGLPEWFDDNLNTHCLVSTEDGLFAGLGDTVWVSQDEGNSWDTVASDLPKITCLA